MQKLALFLVLPLAACASVEERTDARSGAGFTTQTIDGASAPGVVRQQVQMRGFEPVPVVTASGASATIDEAAKLALAQGGADAGSWAPMPVGGVSYSLRQVNAGAFRFGVADPQGSGGALTPALVTQTEVRTGCKSTGRTFTGEGRFAIALDCS